MSLEDLSHEELLAHAKRSDEQARLFRTLIDSPETRGRALALVKEKNPTMPIPEIDAQAEIDKKLAAEREARQKLEQEMRERDVRDRIDRERARCMKAYELTEVDMNEVEKIMTDEKAPIPHYDAACKVYKASKVQATPTPALLKPPKWDMPEKDVWAPGVGNRTKLNEIALTEAYRALNEITSGKAAA